MDAADKRDAMNRENPHNRTRKLALGAVSAALVVLVLYMIPVIPTNTISLYALSSFFVSVIIIEADALYGWVFYTASSLLGFLIVPDKTVSLMYISFFGLYGLIKYYIEKIKYRFVQYFIKLAAFNLFLTAAYFFAWKLIMGGVKAKLPVAIIVIVLEIVFILYDYVYTLFIRYYRQKLRRMLRL